MPSVDAYPAMGQAAAVLAAPESRTPATSAVLAGWICVGIGLLTAWFFPLAHVFFSIGIILSIVAMATHQVRSGLLLLAGSLASIVFCALLFIFCVAAVAASAVHAASRAQPAMRATPRPTMATAFGAATPAFPSYVAPTTTYGSDSPVLGTGARPVASTPPARTVIPAPALPVIRVLTPTAPLPTPVDYAARDRQIADLQKRIDQLDETVRQVRANPHYYGSVSGSTNTARQQSSDAYLDQLDKQRNDLRRQKWALEGR